MKITKERFENTSRWIKRNARPLESALWSYHFEDRNAEGAINCIEAFQNDDGGFGMALNLISGHHTHHRWLHGQPDKY
ncbi:MULTISPECIES: hypothetical protein [Bacillaceae]|uniref:hypothetical protein n=1 Tax=Bacillaceae TaxID=186817 RepID=UPI0021888A52|nr:MULTISPECIES: hypothetical protein [Bacillaceae]URM34596.1 hypothetical protein LLY41_09515 [Cytobacillus firmus]